MSFRRTVRFTETNGVSCRFFCLWFNMASFSEDHKREVRKKQFPADLGKAFEMGARLSV